MDDAAREMARRCYGYGRWDAPYWFIGPEQGMALNENNDLQLRVDAWLHLDALELCDCRAFHERIDQKQWHREKPRLQPTWRPLILMLMTFLEENTRSDDLRAYQRDRWGRLSGGETCVIELSGLAAHSFKVSRDRKLFRQERTTIIRQRMLTYKPTLVIMYGVSEKEHWEAIAGKGFSPDNILTVGSTIIAFTPHPTSHGRGNAFWTDLGERLLTKKRSLKAVV
jgi:hypothetical protein